MNDAFMQFHDLLISKYKLAENEYDDAIDALKNAYNKLQDELIDKTKIIKAEIIPYKNILYILKFILVSHWARI